MRSGLARIGGALIPLLTFALATDVLVLHAGSGWSAGAVQSDLVATGQFGVVDVIDGHARTPSEARLDRYDAVLVYADDRWRDPALLGERLARYVDGGGGVVLGQYAIGEDNQPAGPFRPYLPLLPSPGSGGADELVIEDPASFVFDGVSAVRVLGPSILADAVVAKGARRLASWAAGGPAIAEWAPGGGGTVVGINLFPASSDVFSLSWDAGTDGARLWANALTFAANGAGWNTPARDFRVWVTGACPGLVDVRVGWAAPSARLEVWGGSPGAGVVPSGRCAGQAIPIRGPRLMTRTRADGWGGAWYNPVSQVGCGLPIVAVDLDTCAVSTPGVFPR